MKDLKLLIEAFFMFDQDGGKISVFLESKNLKKNCLKLGVRACVMTETNFKTKSLRKFGLRGSRLRN